MSQPLIFARLSGREPMVLAVLVSHLDYKKYSASVPNWSAISSQSGAQAAGTGDILHHHRVRRIIVGSYLDKPLLSFRLHQIIDGDCGRFSAGKGATLGKDTDGAGAANLHDN